MQSSKEEQRDIRKPDSAVKAKEQRKTIEWKILEISSRKLEIPKEHFKKDGLNKGQKWYGPNRRRKY